VETKFAYRQCNTPGCKGFMEVDGKEYALLRYSIKRCFSYEMLYQWESSCGVKGIAWWTFFRDTLLKYHGVAVRRRRTLMQNVYKQFMRATMDFIQLHDVDYRASFSCSHGAQSLQFDGITIGFHRDRCCLTAPWTASSEGQSVAGSSFQERVFVQEHRHRAALISLAAKQGLATEDLRELQNSIRSLPASRAEHTLLPFLDRCIPIDNKYHAAPVDRDMLHNVGSTTPACQLLRPAAWPVVEQLIGGAVMTWNLHQAVQGVNPALGKFLQPAMGGSLSQQLVAFLRHLLRLARASYVPGQSSAQIPATALGDRDGSGLIAKRVAFVDPPWKHVNMLSSWTLTFHQCVLSR